MSREEELKELEGKYQKLRNLALRLADEMQAVSDRYKQLISEKDAG